MFRLVSGPEMMAQVCLRRLFCRKGSLFSDPLYGIDLRDFLNTKILTAADVARISSLAKSELLQDERIAQVSVTGAFAAGTLTLTIVGTGGSGPFSLVLAVDAVTVQILSAT